MIIVRPIAATDFDDLYQIAVESGFGFTSLPLDEAILKTRISDSIESFAQEVTSAANESYLFVMEDTLTGKVVGTSGIEAAVGLEDAFYHYRLGKVVHSSRELNVYNTIPTLSLCNDYTGAAELCTLFLSKDYRKDNNGKTLAKSRFLFIAQHPHRFAETIIAELRGVSDKNGRSPFWAWLEENFFSLDFPTADYLTGIGKKSFIAELMPKYPIYVSLLNKAAQQVIGKVHKDTLPALKMLEHEGFSKRGYVDIFDAGPTVEAKLSEIRSIQNTKRCKVVITPAKTTSYHLVANTLVKDFRASYLKINLRMASKTTNQELTAPDEINTEQAKVQHTETEVNIAELSLEHAILLKVSEGDTVLIL
ncbi:MAG: arginine N-succinyltransferase [Thalassotalea sp.]